jgi:enediyne biosynthesis protein E4
MVCLGLFVACSTPPDPVQEPVASPAVEVGEPWFADVTAEMGLDAVHDAGPAEDYFMPSSVGGGSALFDFDNDGLLDIYQINNGGPDGAKNRLFRQTAEGQFEDVSEGSGLDVAGFGQGGAVGDVNNDGHRDVVVTEYDATRLFVNLRNGKFREVTQEAGIRNPSWGVSAVFLDYDRDGRLDLYVANYVAHEAAKTCRAADGSTDFCGPEAFPGTSDRLFRNETPPGGRVRFNDVSSETGIDLLPGAGLGAVSLDFDGDGWPDILVANDGQPNHLWTNQQDGTFQESALEHGIAMNGMGKAEANMGIAIGDVEGNGLFDLFVTHLTAETHRLYLQQSSGQFDDFTASAGLAKGSGRCTGWGTLFGDFDQDGLEDLAIVAGRISLRPSDTPDASRGFWAGYMETNRLYRNAGHIKFQDISASNPDFGQRPGAHRGLMCGDVNNDGALDLVVTELDGRIRIFRNTAPDRGHWITVRAVDPELKRELYGAQVTIETGESRWVRWLNPGYSYASSNDPRLHFGLGETDRADSITVDWPDGSREVFDGGPADRFVEVQKGRGVSAR